MVDSGWRPTRLARRSESTTGAVTAEGAATSEVRSSPWRTARTARSTVWVDDQPWWVASRHVRCHRHGSDAAVRAGRVAPAPMVTAATTTSDPATRARRPAPHPDEDGARRSAAAAEPVPITLGPTRPALGGSAGTTNRTSQAARTTAATTTPVG